MKSEDSEADEVRKELYSWIEKNNALTFASGGGNKKVQTLKCMLSYKFFRQWYEEFERDSPAVKQLIEETADAFFAIVGKGVTLTQEEAEKKFKEEGY